MATTRRLAETELAERRPERALDGTVVSYRSQLIRHLRAQSLERHAALFAEPVVLGDRIRWQTDLPGEAVPYDALPPEEQDRVRGLVGTLIGEVRNEAERLRNVGSDSQRRLAEVLDRATRGMRWEDAWLITEAPPESREHVVLAGWGLIAAEGRPPVADLLGESLAPPVPVAPEDPQGLAAPPLPPAPPPLPPAPPEPDPRGWPVRLLGLAALLLLLAGLIAWQLPALAGVLLAFRLPEPPQCEIAPDSPIPHLQHEEARLRARLAELERIYAGRIVQCRIARATPPPAPPTPPPPAQPAPPPARPAAPATPPTPPQRSEIDQRLDREQAQRSDYQITLSWDGPADLDLHVDCPGGQQIFHGSPDACGGRLDVDMNAGARRSDRPIENVVWSGTPAPGTWRVRVVYFDFDSRRTPVPYRLRIVTDGQSREIQGVASRRDAPPAAEFTVR